MTKTLRFIRKLPWEDGNPFDLIVQLPIWSNEDMYHICKPLVDEIGGYRGLGYTAWFRWSDRNRVEEFYKKLGYDITHIDEREYDKKIRAMLSA